MQRARTSSFSPTRKPSVQAPAVKIRNGAKVVEATGLRIVTLCSSSSRRCHTSRAAFDAWAL